MDKIFLIVGMSASGKSAIVNELEKAGWDVLPSYTTRSPRYEGEAGHIFVTEAEYEKFKANGEIVAYTFFDGSHYFSTKQQLYDNQIYVIDPLGVIYLKSLVKDIEFVTIYIKVDEKTRYNRLLQRDGKEKAWQRWQNDIRMFKDLDFDYAVPNYNLKKTVEVINSIMVHERWDEVE